MTRINKVPVDMVEGLKDWLDSIPEINETLDVIIKESEKKISTDVTLINGFEGKLNVIKYAYDIICLSIYITKTPTDVANTAIAFLPTGYVPETSIVLPVLHVNSGPYGSYNTFL